MDKTTKDMLHLVKRSPVDSDGWRKVSAAVWPLVVGLPADLFSLEPSISGGGRLRMTERGQAVLDYL